MSLVLGLWFEGLIDDNSSAMLLGRFEAAAFDVAINSPARDTVTGCIFIDGEEELGLTVKHCLGFNGLDVLSVLWFSECFIHN